MTKAQLVERIAAQSRMTKKSAAEILDNVFRNIGNAVRTDARFSYPGFGTWMLRERKARRVRHPQTNELMKLEASRTVRFVPPRSSRNASRIQSVQTRAGRRSDCSTRRADAERQNRARL